MVEIKLKIMEKPAEMVEVEDLQRIVWPENETEIVPVHMLIAATHGGGLVIGAHDLEATDGGRPRLAGFVFGFPGFYATADGPRLKHNSHMLAVHPAYRDSGLGFMLKRAQWQMVRHQGIDRVTWTFDPLMSRNAHLNIAKLGAVCNTYIREMYGEMRDGLNVGLPSDRFEVDWWVNTKRVDRRLGRRVRPRLDLAHYFDGGAQIINPSQMGENGLLRPGPITLPPQGEPGGPTQAGEAGQEKKQEAMLLLEIPSDFLAIKTAGAAIALEWRLHTRELLEELFRRGYLVTDFVHLPGAHRRSFYVLSHGESTL